MDLASILAFAGGTAAAAAFFKLRDWNVHEDARIKLAIEEEDRQFRTEQEAVRLAELHESGYWKHEEELRKDRELAAQFYDWYDRNNVIDLSRGLHAQELVHEAVVRWRFRAGAADVGERRTWRPGVHLALTLEDARNRGVIDLA